MILLAGVTVAFVAALLRTRSLAVPALRGVWMIVAALGIQIVVVNVVDGVAPIEVAQVAHLVSYAVAAAFLWVNRRVPGLWVVVLGGAMNLAAILANGGVMPASPAALRIAGVEDAVGEFENSAAVDDPNLAVLGDVFAVPEAWPMSNVFSVGDVVLVVGAYVLLSGGTSPRSRRRTSRLSRAA